MEASSFVITPEAARIREAQLTAERDAVKANEQQLTTDLDAVQNDAAAAQTQVAQLTAEGKYHAN